MYIKRDTDIHTNTYMISFRAIMNIFMHVCLHAHKFLSPSWYSHHACMYVRAYVHKDIYKYLPLLYLSHHAYMHVLTTYKTIYRYSVAAIMHKCMYTYTCIHAHRCIVGKLPFDGPVFLNIVQAITQTPTPDVRGNSPTSVSDRLERVISRALAKNPDQRYPSAKAMRLDLEGTDDR
jgi:hypothetical protein